MQIIPHPHGFINTRISSFSRPDKLRFFKRSVIKTHALFKTSTALIVNGWLKTIWLCWRGFWTIIYHPITSIFSLNVISPKCFDICKKLSKIRFPKCSNAITHFLFHCKLTETHSNISSHWQYKRKQRGESGTQQQACSTACGNHNTSCVMYCWSHTNVTFKESNLVQHGGVRALPLLEYDSRLWLKKLTDLEGNINTPSESRSKQQEMWTAQTSGAPFVPMNQGDRALLQHPPEWICSPVAQPSS